MKFGSGVGVLSFEVRVWVGLLRFGVRVFTFGVGVLKPPLRDLKTRRETPTHPNPLLRLHFALIGLVFEVGVLGFRARLEGKP